MNYLHEDRNVADVTPPVSKQKSWLNKQCACPRALTTRLQTGSKPVGTEQAHLQPHSLYRRFAGSGAAASSTCPELRLFGRKLVPLGKSPFENSCPSGRGCEPAVMAAACAVLPVWACFAVWLLAASTSPQCMCSKWYGVRIWGNGSRSSAVRRVETGHTCMLLPLNVRCFMREQLTSLSALTASMTDRYAPIQKREPPTTAQVSKKVSEEAPEHAPFRCEACSGATQVSVPPHFRHASLMLWLHLIDSEVTQEPPAVMLAIK
jgi:hypothetical protein